MPETVVKKATKVEEPAVDGESKGVETVEKAEFDRVVAEYTKLANAFNKLMKEYNELHLKQLFTEEQK